MDASPIVQPGASWPPRRPPRRGSEYAQLSRQVKEAGLLERRPATTSGRSRSPSWRWPPDGPPSSGGQLVVAAGVAAFLAVIFTQVGFLGHDAGHRQIFGTRRANYVLGVLLGNLGIGLSYGWWASKHNRHHAHPNTEDADPDIVLGALAFTGARRAPAAAAPAGVPLPGVPVLPACCCWKRSACTLPASGR